MSLTRRRALQLLAGTLPAALASPALRALARVQARGQVQSAAPLITPVPPIAAGPFVGTRASLAAWRPPDWFHDAKFGIWAHWGPQSAAEAGDWYARNMYMQGSRQYNYHVKTYGHPTRFGYKDIVPTWHGDRFDPNYLMGLYKRAGAKYFMSMGVHHDNFDLWNSKHTRWNAANMGIRRDVVGLWKQAAAEHGLPFAVSDHLWISYKWFAVSHLADKSGPLAGVAYDGVDPDNADLYHDFGTPPVVPTANLAWDETQIPESWKAHWFLRIRDLIDNYQPDMIYSDGNIQFEDYGLNLIAHFYNADAARHGGACQAVYTSKRREDCAVGACALDVERGVVDAIWPQPFQTDTCVGEWHYNRDAVYKTPKTVIDMLVDVVSRNGNLMLNFPLPNSGMLDDRELRILAAITDWMAINGEAIYATRPWRVFGNSAASAAAPASGSASFNESKRQNLGFSDLRYTTGGAGPTSLDRSRRLNVFAMGWPAPGEPRELLIADLGPASPHPPGRIERVRLLGHGANLPWKQEAGGLRIMLPAERPCDFAVCLAIDGNIA